MSSSYRPSGEKGFCGKSVGRWVRQNKMAAVGVAMIMFFVLIALFSPLLAPYDPSAFSGKAYQRPDVHHPLGVNDIGQDILSEMIYATRVSLSIGVLAAVCIIVTGSAFGMMAAYFRGMVDTGLMALTNIALSMPGLPLTVVLVAYIGGGMWQTVLVICITAWAGTARVVRARTLQICEMPFIKIEKALGASDFYIIARHIFPNLMDIVCIRFSTAVGGAMLTESSLSFLGLSSYTQKSWGNILHYAFFRNGLLRNLWWWYLPPILCISLCTLGFSLLVYQGKRRSAVTLHKGIQTDA